MAADIYCVARFGLDDIHSPYGVRVLWELCERVTAPTNTPSVSASGQEGWGDLKPVARGESILDIAHRFGAA